MERVHDEIPKLNRGLSDNGWELEELLSLDGSDSE